MQRWKWCLIAFALMYAVATVLGFATYLLISPVAMWVAVFTLMPLVAAALICWFLKRLRCTRKQSLRETAWLLSVWIVLSFVSDAVTYVVIVPAILGNSPNWRFFLDQSPWIWLSYAVLIASAYLGQRMFVRMFVVQQSAPSGL